MIPHAGGHGTIEDGRGGQPLERGRMGEGGVGGGVVGWNVIEWKR